MSIPIINQAAKIKKCFNLLVQQFIKDPKHKDFEIHFKDFSKPEKQGETIQTTIGSIYKYEVNFLAKGYKNEEEWRSAVVHEFTHLYLFSTVGSHDHDDRFYSQMEYVESWLDKNQGWAPRVDKSHDRDQYVGSNITTCPNCSHPVPQHFPQCPRSDTYFRPACRKCEKKFALGEKYWKDASTQLADNPPNYCQSCGKINGLIKNKILVDPTKIKDFYQLTNLLKNSKNLAILENNYQIVKNNPLYSDKILNKVNEHSYNNKKIIDSLYQTQKWHLQSQNNNQSPANNSKSFFGDESGTDNIFWLWIAIVGIVLIGLMIYLIGRESSFERNPRRKKI